jgi:hypothetical protein
VNDWQSLVETEGVALTTPVLKRVFPQGIAQVSTEARAAVREKLVELQNETIGRREWTRFVLRELLKYGDRLLEGNDGLILPVPEHGTDLAPQLVLIDPNANGDGRRRLLVFELPHGTPLDRPLRGGNWAATPAERAERLCRHAGVELAILTDGEQLRVIWAGADGQTGHATWPTEFLGDERDLLSAFAELLGVQRFFAVAPENRLDALYRESVTAQHELTRTLGRQVRQAVELLVNAIGRADRAEANRLLEGIEPREVYEAAVTVLMRVVFLLYAEERRLLPLDDPVYNANYAILPIRERLEERSRLSDEALGYAHGSWSRVLATSRAVYGGIQHERLRLPAYGGSLFDPDRYPFLEGREVGSGWRVSESRPMPVDDRTMLAVLSALQQLNVKGELRSLSFRQLAVEQIGHVYEGLLDHGCVRADDVVVGLQGKEGAEPELALVRLEESLAEGGDALVDFVVEETKLTRTKVQNLVIAHPAAEDVGALSAACGHDEALTSRVRPFLPLLRRDLNDLPMVFPPGSMYVTQTGQRRDSGTAYTTPELADEVVLYALEPQVYAPGPTQTAERSDWRLKSSAEILALKVCDPAVGSGAILVAAVRYLAERLVEAWRAEIEDGRPVRLLDGVPEDDWELIARRAVVDHCIYGVDRNPMAVEMAKLSLWLTTMAHDRPFTFLDHQLRSGDSLLGIIDLDQLRAFHPEPASHEARQFRIFDPKEAIEPRVERALAVGQDIAGIDVRTMRDADRKRDLQLQLGEEVAPLAAVADALSGALLASAGSPNSLDGRLRALGDRVRAALTGDSDVGGLRAAAQQLLDTDLPERDNPRRPLHWPLAYPEVFLRERAGFDAIVGNPPFLDARKISGTAGSAFRNFLVATVAAGKRGTADLVAYFYLRAVRLLARTGTFGLLATNTIAQGDTREVGLDQLVDSGLTIHRAVKSRPWPGGESLEISQVWAGLDDWAGEFTLDGSAVQAITTSLTPASRVSGRPERLAENKGKSFQGAIILGMGFTIAPEEAAAMAASDPKNEDVLKPYLTGSELNDSPTHEPGRWVVDFGERDEDEARAFKAPWAHVERGVKPERLRGTADEIADRRRRYPRMVDEWWKYWNPRPGLYDAIRSFNRVLVITRHSKAVLPAFIPTGQVFGDATVVFAYEDDFHFGVLTSAFHWWWTQARSSTLETRTRYTPTDCFETFPQPAHSDAVESAGRALDEHRRQLMIDASEGLTKTYNRVHDPGDAAPAIVRLRELHVVLDHAVRDAYGWKLELDHGFHSTDHGMRFTLGSSVRVEVLDLLLEENHRRHEAEVKAGLVSSDGKKKSRSKRTASGASLF